MLFDEKSKSNCTKTDLLLHLLEGSVVVVVDLGKHLPHHQCHPDQDDHDEDARAEEEPDVGDLQPGEP